MGMHDRSTPPPGWAEVGQSHQVFVQYIRIMKLHHAILDRRLSKTGVYRSQSQILMLLKDHSNVSQKDIAQWLNVSTATVAVSVKKLEKGGFITRLVDQEDNRFNKLCLTDKGREIMRCNRDLCFSLENQMFQGFEQDEFDAMEGYLSRIYENLKKIETDMMTERKED